VAVRVFITGATGYIGSAVCVALKARGHDVVGLARSTTAINKLKAAGVHPVPGSMRSTDVLKEMTHDADAVICCAFEQSADGPQLEGLALDAMLGAVDTDHEAFIYTSGVWVYGDTGGRTLDETAPLNPIPLVAWRPAHERKVQDAQRHNLRTVIIRPGIVYGGRGGILGMMRSQAGMHELAVVGSGENHWPMVHVEALAELYVLAMEKAPADSIYNAVGEESVKYGEIVRAIARAAGDHHDHRMSLEDAREVMGRFADALVLDQRISGEKAVRELQWNPKRRGVLEELRA